MNYQSIQKKRLLCLGRVMISLFMFFTFTPAIYSQTKPELNKSKAIHDADLKHSIGSSLYLLGNLMYKEPVYDLHLNYGYRFTKKDVLIVEGMT